MVLVNDREPQRLSKQEIAPQFKGAVKTFGEDIAILISQNPQRIMTIFREVLYEIKRNKYRRQKKKKSCPRVSMKAVSKWTRERAAHMKKYKNEQNKTK